MSNSKVIEVPENILSSLKCAKCSLHLSVTPITYDKGHNLICGRCQDTKSNFVRAKAYESVINLLLFPCRYSVNGCQAKIKSANILSHESKCNHGDLKCPFLVKELCNWRGSPQLLQDHCRKIHSNLIIAKPLKFKMSLKANLLDVKLFSLANSIFVIRYSVNTHGNVYFSVQSVSIMEEKNKIVRKYEIEFKSLCENSVVKFSNSLLNYNDNIDDVFSNGHVKVSTEILQSILNTSNGEVLCVLTVTGLENHQEIKKLPTAVKESPVVKKVEENSEAIGSSSILKELKCPKCLNILKAPIRVCTNGHSFCSKCLDTNNVCLICRGTYDGTRNIMLEKIIGNMQLPCENQNLGCKYIGIGESLVQHMIDCSLKRTNCPLKMHSCSWQGGYKMHYDHLKEVHKNNSWIKEGDTIHYDLKFYSSLCFNVLHFNDVLIRIRFGKSSNGTYSWTFHQIGIKEGYLTPYRIQIEFVDQTQSRKSLTVGLPCYGCADPNPNDDFHTGFELISPFISKDQLLAVKYIVTKITN